MCHHITGHLSSVRDLSVHRLLDVVLQIRNAPWLSMQEMDHGMEEDGGN